jgi:ADP-ribosylglycohydrolase
MEDRYIATMVLHALGDTIGFKNGEWEFKSSYTDLRIVLELVFEFIELGGINGISLKGWNISDDTIFHMAIARALLDYSGTMDKAETIKIKDHMIDAYNQIINDETKDGKMRYMGDTTEHSIAVWTDDIDARNQPYDPMSGGNGCAMRNLCIGLAFYGEKNRDKLIDFAITTSMFTHNSPYGFLGGLTSALFTSYAVEGIPMEKWPYNLVEVLDSDKVKSYIDKDKDDVYFDYRNYIRYWRVYIETRFSHGKPLKMRSNTNLLFRSRYYLENFTKKGEALGGSGFCAMIMAYDSLLDCDGKWEKLIFYAILNPGDSDTIGAIAGGLYGMVYGFGDVPKHMLKHLEERDNIANLGKKLYSTFYTKQKLKKTK